MLGGFEGSLIAFTTTDLVLTLESPVTRVDLFHFILAMRSMRAALVCGSRLLSLVAGA